MGGTADCRRSAAVKTEAGDGRLIEIAVSDGPPSSGKRADAKRQADR
jgi:hypothetical protein